jgi:hypothetical protein
MRLIRLFATPVIENGVSLICCHVDVVIASHSVDNEILRSAPDDS